MKKIQSAALILFFLLNHSFAHAQKDSLSDEPGKIDWEVFPIVSYDTDTGFGYGIKGYIRNIFKGKESYDLILYNSTKGERWYRFQFSLPDYELRQGIEYGYALDIITDYDKWINYYFYGIGNSSTYDNKNVYTKEPFEIDVILNRTITANIIIQAGLKYERIKVIDFPSASLPPDYSFRSTADQLSILLNALYDTRNSIINPDRGFSSIVSFETSPVFAFTNSSFSKILVTFQSYKRIFFPRLVFAGRISAGQLIGRDIPVQFLLPAGGNQTLRGFRQDRFLDKSRAFINAELRFPIWKRLGGIAGIDAGRVFPSLEKFSFNKWKINPVAGLRYYMNNFVVRADMGISNETIGFYLNFGHIF